ncbi:decarboxylase, partial [Streptomyces sp. SID5914]|nr:decarboxylase [Streptomyces sp. SID5914]
PAGPVDPAVAGPVGPAAADLPGVADGPDTEQQQEGWT